MSKTVWVRLVRPEGGGIEWRNSHTFFCKSLKARWRNKQVEKIQNNASLAHQRRTHRILFPRRDLCRHLPSSQTIAYSHGFWGAFAFDTDERKRDPRKDFEILLNAMKDSRADLGIFYFMTKKIQAYDPTDGSKTPQIFNFPGLF